LAQDGEEDFFYQPQRARGQRLDPAIGRMALAAGGVSVIIIVVAFAWSGFHAGSFGPPPVINPPSTPLRVAPASPGGLVVPGADVPIMSGNMSGGGTPQLAPQGQVPDVAQLDQAAGLNQPPPAPAPAPAPATATAPPAGAPAPMMATTPAATPAATPVSAAAVAVKPGPAQVQLAATPDEGGAEAAWVAAQKQAPDLLAGKNPIILPAVINGQSVWRVRLSGFASAAAAQAFCAELTAKGAACTVAGS
jgi:hypothetical protein